MHCKEKVIVEENAVLKIQSLWRGVLARLYCATKTEREEAAALKMTSVARGFLLRLVVNAEKRNPRISRNLPYLSFTFAF